MCTLEALRHAIRRRDVFVPTARRWGDPRRLLLDKATWRANQVQVLRSLDPTGGARRLLDRLGFELDAAYHRAAAVVTEQPELLVFDHDVGRQRFKIPPLDALAVPESTTALRERLAALLPAGELPEVMLEVDAWTGFTAPMTDMVTGGGTRASDLAVSVCAVLVVQACNVPYDAVARRDVPALTEARLRWVEENYVRAHTITAANARLVDHQRQIPLVAHWGGGQLTSADGMRFVVPVRSIHAAPNPRYFGAARGITLFNYVADNFLGWANIVITGTKRDTQFLLDRILDNPTTPSGKDVSRTSRRSRWAPPPPLFASESAESVRVPQQFLPTHIRSPMRARRTTPDPVHLLDSFLSIQHVRSSFLLQGPRSSDLAQLFPNLTVSGEGWFLRSWNQGVIDGFRGSTLPAGRLTSRDVAAPSVRPGEIGRPHCSPRQRVAASFAATTKSRIRPGSLTPRTRSTPLETSTPQGDSEAIARATLPIPRPPATIHRPVGRWERPSQSHARPAPGVAASTTSMSSP